MMIKFREIEVFWAVYKCQSVKEAARLLNVSQPAVSMMLKSAEERFGIKLFNRLGGRVQPTSGARHLFGYTENLLLDLHEFERQMLHLREGRTGSVSVAATPTLAAAFLHPALPAFQQKHPGVRMQVRTVPTDQAVDLIVKRLVDFGIAYGPASSTDVDVEDLGLTQISCILHKDHRLTQKTLITPADLVGESVATYRADAPLGREMERVLREAGSEVNVMVQSTALTAAQLAERGFCVALIDPLALNGGLFHSLTMRPFEPTTTARVQVLKPKADAPSKAAQHLIQQIRTFVPRQKAFSRPVGKSASARA